MDKRLAIDYLMLGSGKKQARLELVKCLSGTIKGEVVMSFFCDSVGTNFRKFHMGHNFCTRMATVEQRQNER